MKEKTKRRIEELERAVGILICKVRNLRKDLDDAMQLPDLRSESSEERFVPPGHFAVLSEKT
jgi:hypothetical protein